MFPEQAFAMGGETWVGVEAHTYLTAAHEK
jgi:hypothetical protein